MCPNIRALNKLTIKDKFHFPIIDDILDELHGSKFLTQLDLLLRYHQINMTKTNIPRIASKTHEAPYEFLVTPFCLFNALDPHEQDFQTLPTQFCVGILR